MRRKWIICALALLCVCALAAWYGTRSGGSGLPTPEEAAAMTAEAATEALAGTLREELLKVWGEPEGCLSGLFGNVYQASGERAVTVYYDAPSNGGPCVSAVNITEW